MRLVRGILLGGEPYWVAHQDWARTRIVPAGVVPGGEGAPGLPTMDSFPRDVLVAGVQRMRPGLDGNRPLWDIVVLLLMAGGTALSLTGVVLTGRWVERKTGR